MLTGEKVRLRKYEMSDLERVLTWINDREVTQYVSARYPMSEASEREWLHKAATQSAHQELLLAIETLEGQRHLGSIALEDIAWEARQATLGIVIGEKDYWGKGYGTDAIITLLRYGFDWMNLNRVVLDVYPDNQRAIASYRKCGFVEEGRLRQHHFARGSFQDLVVMGVLRDEFEALHDKSQPVEVA